LAQEGRDQARKRGVGGGIAMLLTTCVGLGREATDA
jgi:hypothetical protein